jgi:hypothetical protein
MFRFTFSKKPTIFLLLSIIVISLIFSILLKTPVHEGLDTNEAIINNPPPDVINKIDEILKNTSKDKLEKLSNIRDVLKNKYKVLGDIYRQNESSILKELSTTLATPPKRDSEGKLFDEDALTGENRDAAIKLISSNDYSGMEKIQKIKSMAGNDKTVNTVLNEYIDTWLKMVSSNIDKIRSTANDVVVPIPSP